MACQVFATFFWELEYFCNVRLPYEIHTLKLFQSIAIDAIPDN